MSRYLPVCRCERYFKRSIFILFEQLFEEFDKYHCKFIQICRLVLINAANSNIFIITRVNFNPTRFNSWKIDSFSISRVYHDHSFYLSKSLIAW